MGTAPNGKHGDLGMSMSEAYKWGAFTGSHPSEPHFSPFPESGQQCLPKGSMYPYSIYLGLKEVPI